MRILLVNPYSISQDPNEQRFKKPYPPLGILYIASYLRDNGVNVSFYDATFEVPPFDPFKSSGNKNPDWVGFYCLNISRRTTFDLIRAAKERDCRVMVGGPDSSMDPAPYLKAGADLAVIGEGEVTALEVVNEWTGPNDHEIDGTAYMKNGGVVRSRPRDRTSRIDLFPFPARDLVPIDKYMAIWKEGQGHSMLNMVTSRGCPYGCKWCCRPIFGNVFRQRSVHNVIAEVRSIKGSYGPDRLWFSDDILPMKKEWVKEFSIAMSKLGIEFECLSRVDLMDDEVALELKRAGCRRVHLGIESGSQIVLDSMGKGTTVEQIKKAAKALKGAGVEQNWFIIYGYPGEDKKELLSTMALVQKTQPEGYGITIAYPMPGTEFYEEVKDRLKREDWVQTLDNKLVFTAEHSQFYYNAAILWTHGVVRTGRWIRKFPVPLYMPWDALTLLSADLVLSSISLLERMLVRR